MEKFLQLSEEKQNKIIDAAMRIFGSNGYKKASVSEIANAAGISKAMVFYYFGTKRALYLYLINLCKKILFTEMKLKFDKTVTDFFDRITLAGNIKLLVMQRYPAIFPFLKSIYFETDEEVREDITKFLENSEMESFRYEIIFQDLDVSKFKEGINVELVMKMLIWISEGYLSQYTGSELPNLEIFYRDFYECMNLLKSNLYKEI